MKKRHYVEAKAKYSSALKVAQLSKELYKETAVVYSNQANLSFTLKGYEDALANAIAAINVDKEYHKVG